MDKPFAPACERNQEPILERLQACIGPGPARILEIGSGTGQHAVHFGQARPDWLWQCTDQAPHLPGIGMWLQEAGLANLPTALPLDVSVEADWAAVASEDWDWLYTANSLHIMSWGHVQALFAALPKVLGPHSGLLIYGPFNRNGQFTSASNAAFDASLRQRDASMGIRDLEAISALAAGCGLGLQEAHPMPANNFLLEFRPLPEA